jgi:hypothetical protein
LLDRFGFGASAEGSSGVTVPRGAARVWVPRLEDRWSPHKRGAVLLTGAVGAILLELAAYRFQGIASFAASRLWVLHGLLCMVAMVGAVGGALAADVKERNFLLPALFLGASFIIGLFGVVVPDRVELNCEATQEAAAGLSLMKGGDMGYTQSAFLGYPSRHYLVAALPSRLFGPGLSTLRMGFAIPVLAGLLVCYAGLRSSLRSSAAHPGTAAVILLGLFSFPFIPRFVQHYEQSCLPLAYTLLAVGMFLLAIERPTPVRFLGFAWSGAMLGTCYTPALAACGLGVAAALILSFRERESEGLSWLAAAVFVAGITACSLLTRGDVRLLGSGGADAKFWGDLRSGLSIFFFGDSVIFIGPALVLPLFAYLVRSLLRRHWLDLLIWAWAMLVVAMAVTSHGYASPPPELAIHRAMIVAPPLVVAFALRWFLPSPSRADLASLVAVAAVLLAFPSRNLYLEQSRFALSPRDAFVRDVLAQTRALGVDSGTPFVLAVISEMPDLVNIPDYLPYFFPSATLVRSADGLRNRDGGSPRLVLAYVDPKLADIGSLTGSAPISLREPYPLQLRRFAVGYRGPGDARH